MKGGKDTQKNDYSRNLDFGGDSDYYRFTNLGKKSWLDEKKYIYFLVSAFFIRFSTLLHFFIPFLISLLKDFLGDFKVRL